MNPKKDVNYTELKKQFKHIEVLFTLVMKSLFLTTELVPASIKWFLRCLHRCLKRHFPDSQSSTKTISSILFQKWLVLPMFLAPSCYFTINACLDKSHLTSVNKTMSKFNKLLGQIFDFATLEEVNDASLGVFGDFVKSHQKRLGSYMKKLYDFDFHKTMKLRARSRARSGDTTDLTNFEKIDDEIKYREYHDRTFNLVCVSEGVIIKIFNTFKRYIDDVDNA